MNKVPITIITGFLGSGKTTLLNHILNSNQQLRAAVLVNDFGEINIDAELITNISGETISLANGCVCCTIRGDFIEAVLGLFDRPEPPEHIIIEASGVSDPTATAMSFVMSPKLASLVKISGIIAVLDCEHFNTFSGRDRILAEEQIGAADIVILNKSDLVSGADLANLEHEVRDIHPSTRILRAVNSDVPLELILDAGSRSLDKLLAMDAAKGSPGLPNSHDHHHDRQFSSWSWLTDKPLEFQRIYEAFKTLNTDIFRAKGILNLNEVADKQVILQMVGKRITLSKGRPWKEQSPLSKIVVIGANNKIDSAELERLFNSCIATKDSPVGNPLAEAVINILRSPNI